MQPPTNRAATTTRLIMRNLAGFLLILITIVTIGGCDSNDERETYADILVGTWSPYYVGDETGDLTGTFLSEVTQMHFRYRDDETTTLFLTYNTQGHNSGYRDVRADGSFKVPSAGGTITMDMVQPATILRLDFNFDGRDTLYVGGDTDDLNPLLGGKTLAGAFELVLERVDS